MWGGRGSGGGGVTHIRKAGWGRMGLMEEKQSDVTNGAVIVIV